MAEEKHKESKEEKFKRVASRRTQKVLNALRLLGNCSNKSVYAYTNEDVSKIFGAIDKEIRKIKPSFNGKSKKNKFTL